MIRISHARTLRLCYSSIFFLALTACGKQAADSSCKAIGGNLLQDTVFTTVGAPRAQRQWQSSEHSAKGSFSYMAAEGVLTIEQKGLEPWMIVTQSPDAGLLAGKVVEFSADLKLDLAAPERAHGFKLGGGLALVAKNNGKLAVNSMLDHEPHMGIHDWQTVRVVVALPMMIDYLQVGFLHQAGGVMMVRNPMLRQVAKTCPLTP